MAKKSCIVGMKLVVAIVALISAANWAEGAVSCSDAVNALIPCGSYLIGAGGENPSNACCASAKALDKLATTKVSRRQLCECLKETGPSFGVVPEKAKKLPSFCKLNLNIPVSPTVNCNLI